MSEDTKAKKAKSEDTKAKKAKSEDTKAKKAKSEDTKAKKAKSEDTKAKTNEDGLPIGQLLTRAQVAAYQKTGNKVQTRAKLETAALNHQRLADVLQQ